MLIFLKGSEQQTVTGAVAAPCDRYFRQLLKHIIPQIKKKGIKLYYDEAAIIINQIYNA